MNQSKQWIQSQQNEHEEYNVSQLRKQRHFDEQKQRLKELDTKKIKNSFSADAMIQNILTKDNTTLIKDDKLQVKRGTIFGELETAVSCIGKPQPNIYKSSSNVQSNNACPSSYQSSFSNVTTQPSLCTSLDPQIQPQNLLPSAQPSFSKMQSANVSRQTYHSKPPVRLPKWLTDSSQLPKIYKAACGLVEDNDGWVDTKRAYMLLMQTNIPPQFLGVVWEMVNRTKPGLLTIPEFCELLSLVALLQKGQSFTSPDILSTQVDPVLPLIDHPVLLPLVEEHLKKMTDISSVSEDDDFDDFVSAVPLASPSQEQQSLNPNCTFPNSSSVLFPSNNDQQKQEHANEAESKMPSFTINANSMKTPSVIAKDLNKVQLPLIQRPPIEPSSATLQLHPTSSEQTPPLFEVLTKKSSENERSLNFPRLGSSPLNGPKSLTLQPVTLDTNDDGFDDFQSAPPPVSHIPAALPSMPSPTSSVSMDKYAVFREFSADNDETIGDFLSNDCKSLSSDSIITNTNLMQEEPPINDTDWNKAAYTDLESSQQKVIMFAADFSSDSSQYVTASASAATSSDDDFGDFIGPSSVPLPTPLFVPSIAETVSVNSLELPGLEVTVNLTVDKGDTKVQETPSLNDVLFNQDFSSTSTSTDVVNIESLAPVSIDLVPPTEDRYSFIREEVNEKNDCSSPLESWKLCLESCVQLLKKASITFKTIQELSLMEEVLVTSQMTDYLTNLYEVYLVRQRIESSSQRLTETDELLEPLLLSRQLWKSIQDSTNFKPCPIKESVDDCVVCGVCLLSGGASLVNGSYSYHPPCANFWLNTVDSTLPTLSQR